MSVVTCNGPLIRTHNTPEIFKPSINRYLKVFFLDRSEKISSVLEIIRLVWQISLSFESGVLKHSTPCTLNCSLNREVAWLVIFRLQEEMWLQGTAVFWDSYNETRICEDVRKCQKTGYLGQKCFVLVFERKLPNFPAHEYLNTYIYSEVCDFTLNTNL